MNVNEGRPVLESLTERLRVYGAVRVFLLISMDAYLMYCKL